MISVSSYTSAACRADLPLVVGCMIGVRRRVEFAEMESSAATSKRAPQPDFQPVCQANTMR